MSNRFLELLASRPYLLADGATGTNLFAAGLATGEAPDLWVEQRPDEVKKLHQSFIEAGSDLILTNSFGGTRYRLKLHGEALPPHPTLPAPLVGAPAASDR